MTDPWGVDQQPANTGPLPPLPPRLLRLARVQATGVALTTEDPYAEGFPDAGELPEVQSLMRSGWQPLHGAPLYSLLPAAWPAQHRTWVTDRLPRVCMGGTTDAYWGRIAPPPDEPGDWDDFDAAAALAAGLPKPPAGRVWLLRSPWPRIPVVAIYAIVWSIVDRSREPDEQQRMYRVAREVLTWDENRALAACPSPTRDLLDAWALAGRVGEAASAVVEHEITPTRLADALTRTGLDEPDLLAWHDSLGCDLDDDTLTFISAWRSAGLPGNPPPGATRFTRRNPHEVRAWLDSGFDLHAAAQLTSVGLDTALQWRQAGFSEADTYELLRADPVLTPAEARAFDDAGPARQGRTEWIYYGFSAGEAEDWATAGIVPAAARVWRACAKGPVDVRPGDRIPPELLPVGGYFALSQAPLGELGYAGWDDIPDPPGTRGRRARHRSGAA